MAAFIKNHKDGLEIEIPVIDFMQGDIHLRYCPMLDLMTYASEKKNLDVHFHETVETFFEFETELGRLDLTLSKLGWTKEKKKRILPESVNIPSILLAAENFLNRKVPISLPC